MPGQATAARVEMVGAVLTGGRSRRMGRTKALVEVDGVAMASRVADALHSAGCSTVIAYGGDPIELAALPIRVVPDVHLGDGPLGGLLGVLELFEHRASLVFVAACDLPGLSAAVVLPMVEVARSRSDIDVVVARTTDVEPMCAIWNVAATERIRRAFDDGERAIHAVIERLGSVEVAVDPAALRNINTPDDLVRYS